jgi:hypothetical protein
MAADERPEPSESARRAQERAATAGRRAQELRAELDAANTGGRAVRGSSPSEVSAAVGWARAAGQRLAAAFDSAADAHDRAADAHDRAAAQHDAAAGRSGDADGEHARRARHHRVAAEVDRAAAVRHRADAG